MHRGGCRCVSLGNEHQQHIVLGLVERHIKRVVLAALTEYADAVRVIDREAAGLVETRGRFGTFVSRVDPADSAMAGAAHTYVAAAKALGVGKSAAMRYVDTAFG